MTNKNATVHIIDDDLGMLKYISDLVNTVSYKAATYESANNFLEGYSDDGLGCLVLDLRLPGISGLELQQQLPKNNIDLPVIMVSSFGDISIAVKAMKSGILDFLEKPFKGQDLLDLIHKAVAEHKTIRTKTNAQNEAQVLVDSLTKREAQVMKLVVDGQTNKNIAKKLKISIKTVEVHRASVMEKMKVNSVADLVRISQEASKCK